VSHKIVGEMDELNADFARTDCVLGAQSIAATIRFHQTRKSG
jgi:hypothetical protein